MDDPLDVKIDRGKYAGYTWREAIDADRKYVEWAVREWDHLDEVTVEAIEMTCEESWAWGTGDESVEALQRWKIVED